MITVIPKSGSVKLVRDPSKVIRSSVKHMQKVIDIIGQDEVFANPKVIALVRDLEGASWIKGNNFRHADGNITDWTGLSSQTITVVLCTLAKNDKLKDLPWVFVSGLFATSQIPILASMSLVYDFTIACLTDMRWENYPEISIDAVGVDGQALGTCSNLGWYATYN